ncbi:6675_t:CDS:2, partial [Acaulospora colombiana]
GDRERKVASKASYLINQIFSVHPLMKIHVIREVEQLILFPSANERAQYYGVIALNQIILTDRDVEVANKLIDIYFVFFTKLLELKDEEVKKNKGSAKSKNKKKDDTVKTDVVDSKLVAAILTGVNRAYKFARVDDTLYQSLLDPRLDTSSKQAMYLNLLFKALKNDSMIVRVEAFIKRLIQICGHQLPPFICGALYLISVLVQKHPSLSYFITQPEDNDPQEHFVDVSDEEDDERHHVAGSDEEKKSEKDKDKSPQENENLRKYDGRKRDPQYSDADQTCLWELTLFTDHFHPTVALYAKQLLENKPIETQPELHHHTLAHFLDRFVYRNPKKRDRVKGGNVLLQPTVATEPGMVIMRKGAGISPNEINVNSEEFWKKNFDDIPVDQAFFHKYFTQKHSGGKTQKEKKKKSTDGIDNFLDPDQESDEELENEIWESMKSTMPIKLDSDLEDEEDVDELENAYFSSDENDIDELKDAYFSSDENDMDELKGAYFSSDENDIDELKDAYFSSDDDDEVEDNKDELMDDDSGSENNDSTNDSISDDDDEGDDS